MKSTFLAIGTMAAVALAQDLNSLPNCARTCVTNMLGLASELGCTSGDTGCLCMNPDFSYGIRDCSRDVCGTQSDMEAAQNYRNELCSSAGISIMTTDSMSVTATATPSVSTTLISGSLTSTITTVMSSGDSVVTSVIESVIPGLIVSEVTSSGFASPSVTSATTRTTTARTSFTSTAEPTSTDGGNGDGSDSADAAPRATAVPVGLLAVAGVAAFLL